MTCTNCPAFKICPEKPSREDYADENKYLIDLECGVWSCQKTIEKLCKENEQNIKLFKELKEHCDELELINQKVMEENEILKDREEGFKKQIIGLCNKYHQVYERFPELKDAFLLGDRIMQENEQLQEYNTDLKQSLDWANERETEWSNRIEELKTDLEYAKAIIKDLLNNSHEYSRQNAEDFIKGEKK